MMKVVIFLSPIVILLLTTRLLEASQNASYFAYTLSRIRAGSPIQIVAKTYNNSNPVNFTATLKTPAGEINFQIEGVLLRGESKLLTFNEQIPYGYDGTTDFELSIVGIDSVTNETVFRNTTDQLVYQQKSLSMFIQTDKGIYKPSQTIKFRVVVTNSDLLPHNGAVSYKVTDPDDNILLQKKDATLVNGIVGSEFTLGRYATNGTWRISFECQGNAKSVMVKVDEYQLPKFEIDFSPDQTFLHEDSVAYSGKISAKFTFGESVKGEASLLLETSFYRNDFFFGGRMETKSIKHDFENFDGTVDFNVPVEELKRELDWDPATNSYQRMTVTVKVKDKNSQTEIEENRIVNLRKIPFKIEKISTPNSAKPGLFYTAYLRVVQLDDSRITEVQRQSLDMRVKYIYSYLAPYRSTTEYADVNVDKDGYIIFTMRVNTTKFYSISFEVEWKKHENQYFLYWTSTRYNSPSNSYMQLSTLKTSLKPNDTASFEVLSSRNDVTYSVMMMSRGTILKQESYTPETYETENDFFKFKYEFTVTKDMTPTVAVTFYFMADNGEVVADNLIINVETILANKVTYSSNVTNAKTGAPVAITVQATPGSAIAVRAIDRGVILQEDGNDITTEKVLRDLNSYSTSTSNPCSDYYYCYWGNDGTNAKQVLQNTGIVAMTDGAVFRNQTTRGSYGIIYEGGVVEDGEIMFAEAADSARPAIMNREPTTVGGNVQAPKVRKNFPETWIWDETVTGEMGSHTYSLVLPDTTTTWEISVFAVSQLTGIGILDPDPQIVASRDFFISLTLPPTMVEGEVLIMRTTVYNFLPTSVTAVLRLEDSVWYEIVMNKNDTKVEGPERTVTVPSDDGVTEIFTIRFLKSGTAKIKVTALSELASDAIERSLTVKPQGIEKEISQSQLIDRDADDVSDTVTSFDIVIPSNAVEGSVYGKLSVSGSVMGNSWNNLGNLLHMPSGCGEQTMLNFAPDVFISLYLNKVGLLEGEVKRKSSRHIVAGYQNELRYQHKDGSFSAFGHDEHGSTWLTSFVVKSFIAARELNADFVDEKKIDKAITFLLGTQQEDGSFKEDGLVRHKAMQGGVSSKETMTAYVVIALAEGGYKSDQENIKSAIDKARTFLEGSVENIMDPYASTVIAYALAISGSTAATSTMEDLNQIAKVGGNMKYWTTGKDPCSDSSPAGYCWHPEATATDIEMTSYALLTLLRLGRTSETMPIVRWIVKQRNSIGGYRSTQDTVMAIQALSVFAGLHSSSANDLTISANHSAQLDFQHTMSVTEDNAIVLQSVELPPLSGTVQVTTTGVGLADIQMSYKYYLPLEDRANEPFTIDVKVDEVDGYDKIKLTVCSSINKAARNPVNRTGMFVVDVILSSGYTTNNKEASSENTKAKMVELVNNEVTGYYDELPTTGDLCFVVPLDRFMKVGKVKPQMIRAFDYYEPEQMSYRMYVPHKSDDLCDSFGKDLHGCSGGGATSITQSLVVMLIQAAIVAFLCR